MGCATILACARAPGCSSATAQRIRCPLRRHWRGNSNGRCQEPPGESVTHVIIVAAILGLGRLAADPALAQQVPAAIVADPLADKEFPAALAVVSFEPRRRSGRDALSGQRPRAARSSRPAQWPARLRGERRSRAAIRRAGWNVLLFHYRGMWGAGGAFSFSSAIEDTAEAVRFLRDAATATKYRMTRAASL